MDALSIIGVALVVGVVVYALSLRGTDETLTTEPLPPAPGEPHRPTSWLRHRGRRPTGQELGFGTDRADAPEDPESFVYVPVLAAPGTPWRTRIAGIVGLLALVALAGVVVAVGIYQVGHLVNETIRGFLGK